MKVRMGMSWLVGTVVAAHGVAVMLLVLLPGCGRTVQETAKPVVTEEVPMPDGKNLHAQPPAGPVKPVAKIPDAKSWPDATTPYTVASGDTLSGIAHRFNTSKDALMTMNGIKDPNKLRVGQKIMLPGHVDVSKPRPEKKRGSKPATPAKAGAAAASAAATTYTVKANDTLATVAAQHNITALALKDANKLKTDTLSAGQKLTIPKVAAEKKPAGEPAAPAMGVVPVATTAIKAGDAGAPAAGTHVVEEGEDLRSIAMKNMVSISELRKVNKLADDAEVNPGQVLKLPASE